MGHRAQSASLELFPIANMRLDEPKFAHTLPLFHMQGRIPANKNYMVQPRQHIEQGRWRKEGHKDQRPIPQRLTSGAKVWFSNDTTLANLFIRMGYLAGWFLFWFLLFRFPESYKPQTFNLRRLSWAWLSSRDRDAKGTSYEYCLWKYKKILYGSSTGLEPFMPGSEPSKNMCIAIVDCVYSDLNPHHLWLPAFRDQNKNLTLTAALLYVVLDNDLQASPLCIVHLLIELQHNHTNFCLGHFGQTLLWYCNIGEPTRRAKNDILLFKTEKTSLTATGFHAAVLISSTASGRTLSKLMSEILQISMMTCTGLINESSPWVVLCNSEMCLLHYTADLERNSRHTTYVSEPLCKVSTFLDHYRYFQRIYGNIASEWGTLEHLSRCTLHQ